MSSSKRGRSRPGVERAYAYLVDVAGSLSPGERLPGTTALARAVGVAPQTMVRASRRLQHEGVLVTRPRSGTYRTDATAPSPGPWQGTATRGPGVAGGIVRALLAGRLPADRPLPGLKELSASQGASSTAIARALRQLEREGWLERIGRSYRTVLRPRGSHNTLLLIARGATGGDVALARSQDHVRYLQHESASAGARLRLVRYDESRDWSSEARELVSGQGRAGTVLGAIVWPLTVHGPERSRLLHESAQLGVPVAVFDDDDIGLPPGRFGPLVRFFATARGSRAGHDVGRYLLGLGHRTIAFLSASHDSNASQARLAGLRQACAEAGVGRVEACVSDFVTRDRMERPLVDAFARSLETTRVKGPEGLCATVAAGVQRLVCGAVEKEVLLSLAEHAFADSTTTAWVAFNDVLASWSIEWLRARGRSVPGEVSVVGFDESPRALELDLTSYDFGGRAALRAAVTYLLRPALMRRFTPVYEAPGAVVSRGTTATTGA